MANKVLGFYSSSDDAKRCEDDLIKSGFDRSNVKMYSGSEPGLWEKMKEWFGFADEEDRKLYQEAARRGAVAVLVDLRDEDSPGASRATQILSRHHPIDLDIQAQQWRTQGWTGTAARPTTTPAIPAAKQPPIQQPLKAGEVLPVTEEQLQVGKRQVQTGGVRIYSKVTEKPIEEQVQLREEHVSVERRPVDRPIKPGDEAFKERKIEVTETQEQPVVSKEARVVEEVAVKKDVQQRTETVRDTVRRTDVNVEQVPSDRDTSFADRFADEMAADERYRGKEWSAIETNARTDFERRYPNSNWNQFKDAISRGYSKHLHPNP